LSYTLLSEWDRFLYQNHRLLTAL